MNPLDILGWIALIRASKAEARAVKWRKIARVEDDVKFNNSLGTWTHGEITSFGIEKEERVARLVTRSTHGTGFLSIPLSDLYPDLD